MEKLMKQEIDHGEDNLKKRQHCWRIMEVLPELSLGPSPQCHEVNKSTNDDQSSPESESSYLRRKRKSHSGHLFNGESNMTHSVDLQLKDPLPLDWEQCLDLETGRMYYLNRKTLRKSWERPKEQKLDLELNISSSCNNNSHQQQQTEQLQGSKKLQQFGSSNNMVALACLNCHLLVILSKSSPSCPNCKYIHSLPPPSAAPPKVGTNVKSADSLSLLMN